MKSKSILKITTLVIIILLILTMYSVMVPVIATPTEADVINTKEVGSSNVAGGDKIFYYNYVYSYNPGYPSPRLWRETYYEMYEYDTTTDTSTNLGNGYPIGASSNYLAYRYYYYKYWYTNGSRININAYYVRDLNTNVNTKWNELTYGNPTDLCGNNMASLLFTNLGKSIYKFDIYATDLSMTPWSPVLMHVAQATSTVLVKFDNTHISENYIAWMEGNYLVPPPPARYPQINNWPIKLLELSKPMTTPTVLHQTTTTYISSAVRFGKSLQMKTMDDNTVVWTEYDIVTRLNEAKYIDLNTLTKTIFSKMQIGGANLVDDLLYFDVYNSFTRKTQIYECDLTTNIVASTGIVGYIERLGNGAGDYILSLRTYEGQYGADLNGDGDTRDYVIRYIYMTVEATLDIDPDTLNLETNGNWITAYIGLPDGLDVNDIILSTVMLDQAVKAEWCDVQDTTLMVKFDRLDVENLIGTPQQAVELTVEGKLTTGLQFKGTDSIRAINP